MSFNLTQGDRKLLWIAGGAALLMTVLGGVLAPSASDTSDNPSTYSSGSGGAKAAYLLLAASGYSVRRWEESATNLPADSQAIWVLADPEGTPTAEERRALTRFVERGGRVIATGMTGAFFLPEHAVVPDPLSGVTWKRIPGRTPAFVTRQAPEITLAPRAFWNSDSLALPLYGDDNTRVVQYARGLGDMQWWASATPLTNAGLREPGNLEFFLASLGDPRRPILWDEYFHGHRPATSTSLLSVPALAWTAGHLLLLMGAVFATYTRRSGPVMAPRQDSRLSPLEFVRTLGALYRRADAAAVAVDIAAERLRYQLARRLGKPGTATVEDLARALRNRGILDDRAFAELLRSCEAARASTTLKPDEALALTRSLAEYAAKLDVFRRT